MSALVYPQSPAQPREKLVHLTGMYKLRAFLAVLGLLLFFICYLALILGSGYLLYYAITYEMGSFNRFTILLKLGTIAGAAMLFVFTLKFLFKIKNVKPTNRIKLKQEDHPKLWEFVNRICEETGAPRPKYIYADPDVNAYVTYTNPWLSLFLPVRKELTIGMGLVSCLNLSEFKAVVSHEFGHFAQRSMVIGSYLMSANTIIHDMIFSRDKWDDTLDRWKEADFRVSVFAWIITPVIWLIRQLLNLFYQLLNVMYSSLSREMEFNADKVAVSTSGSDAIISALWKLESGTAVWNHTIQHVYTAAQHKKFVNNLYEHHLPAMEAIAASQQESLAKLPKDERGGKRFFAGPEVSQVDMYASHPPNHQREDSAKTPYIACEADERSPWLLFDAKQALQEQMTALFYRTYLDKQPETYVQPAEFEAFVEAEKQGEELEQEYHNTFRDRFLQIPDTAALQKAADRLDEPFAPKLEKLKFTLLQLMEQVWALEALMSKAQQIAAGATVETHFSFEGQEYGKDNLQEGFNLVATRREELLQDKLKNWDSDFCALHLSMARKIGKDRDLLNLYHQHNALNRIYQSIAGTKHMCFSELEKLQSRGEVTYVQVAAVSNHLKDAYQALNKRLEELDKTAFVPLPNINTPEELKEAIIDGGTFKGARGRIFDNGSFNNMVQNMDRALLHCQRIDKKSIGFILSEHKRLQQEISEKTEKV